MKEEIKKKGRRDKEGRWAEADDKKKGGGEDKKRTERTRGREARRGVTEAEAITIKHTHTKARAQTDVSHTLTHLYTGQLSHEGDVICRLRYQ